MADTWSLPTTTRNYTNGLAGLYAGGVVPSSSSTSLFMPYRPISTNEFLYNTNALKDLDFSLGTTDNKITGTSSTTGGGGPPVEEKGFDLDGLFSNEYKMGNILGLAGTVMTALALPQQLKNARLQNESLAYNLATAREEQDRRNRNIGNLNAYRPSSSLVA